MIYLFFIVIIIYNMKFLRLVVNEYLYYFCLFEVFIYICIFVKIKILNNLKILEQYDEIMIFNEWKMYNMN